MTLVAVMLLLAVFAMMLLAAAPGVYQEVQREKELEAIRRGEDVAEAIKQYVIHHNGKLPESMDDLIEGLPQGTKTRQILRASSAIDPLSEDGEWRLIKADPDTLARFAKRVQAYNNGLLPSNPTPALDRYSIMILNSLNTETDEDNAAPEEDMDMTTDNTPFIGVASQSRARSILTYYGLENHSKWVFTPLFRGGEANRQATGARPGTRPSNEQPPNSEPEN